MLLMRVLAVQINHSGQPQPGAAHNGAFGLVIALIGFAMVCNGVLPIIRLWIWRRCALPARGRVVDRIPNVIRRNRTTWSSLVEFEVNGSLVLSTVLDRAGLPLGEPLSLLYDPVDPRQVQLEDAAWPVSTWLLAGAAIIALYLAVAV